MLTEEEFLSFTKRNPKVADLFIQLLKENFQLKSDVSILLQQIKERDQILEDHFPYLGQHSLRRVEPRRGRREPWTDEECFVATLENVLKRA